MPIMYDVMSCDVLVDVPIILQRQHGLSLQYGIMPSDGVLLASSRSNRLLYKQSSEPIVV